MSGDAETTPPEDLEPQGSTNAEALSEEENSSHTADRNQSESPLKNRTLIAQKAIVNKLIQILSNSNSKTSEVNAALKAVFAAESLDLDEILDAEVDGPSEREIEAAVRRMRIELLNDPQYLDYLRKLASDRDAGPLRAGDEPRALETGETPDAS